MSLNPLKTKYPLTSLVLTVLLCTFAGASIGLFYGEFPQKISLTNLYGNYFVVYGDIIPVHTILGGICGAAIGVIIGITGYVINKRHEQIETIDLLEK